jgi:hypothetical protein
MECAKLTTGQINKKFQQIETFQHAKFMLCNASIDYNSSMPPGKSHSTLHIHASKTKRYVN